MTPQRRIAPAVRGARRYALAAFGAHLTYAPLLSLLLPRRIVALAPGEATRVSALILLAGALTASLAHIAAGRISDGWRRRHGDRRAPLALGLILTVVTLAALGHAFSLAALAVGLIVFQAMLNLLLAPLSAVLVDHFADRAKGRVAALASLAMPLATLGTGALALVAPRDSAAPFAAVAVLAALSVAPLVLVWPFAPAAVARAPAAPGAGARAGAARPSGDLLRVALARLLMQIGTAFVIPWFYLFLVRHPARVGLAAGAPVDLLYGRLVLTATMAVLIVTLPAGRWSDRHGRRRAPMIGAALLSAVALVLVQGGSGWALLAGYGLFQVGLIAYLALDTALVAQILRASTRPGEVLGYVNLANTLPSMIVPAGVLALTAAPGEALWSAGFLGAAACCGLAAALVAGLRGVG